MTSHPIHRATASRQPAFVARDRAPAGLAPSGFNRAHGAIRAAFVPACIAFVPVVAAIEFFLVIGGK